MQQVEFRDPKVRSEPTVNCSETIRNYDFVEISDELHFVTLDGVVQQLNPSATHPSTISINIV